MRTWLETSGPPAAIVGRVGVARSGLGGSNAINSRPHRSFSRLQLTLSAGAVYN
ncbi:MAG: hypothetical protein AAF689_07485 [Pseudomonadota bacterium]